MTNQAHPCEIRYLAFSPDGKTLASSAAVRAQPRRGQEEPAKKSEDDTTIRLWDTSSGKERGVCRNHDVNALRFAFSGDGKTLVAAHAGTKASRFELVVWDVESGKIRKQISAPPNCSFVWSIAPDGRTLYYVSHGRGKNTAEHGTIERWDLVAERAVPAWETKLTSIRQLEFSREGKLLVARTDRLSFFDMASGKEVHAYEAHRHEIRKIVFAPDSRTVTTVDESGQLRAWETASGAPLPILADDQKNHINRFGYAGKDALLTVGLDGMAHVWELPSGREKRAFRVCREEAEGQEQRVVRLPNFYRVLGPGTENGMILSMDGQHLAVVDEKQHVQVWDVVAGRKLLSLGEHNDVNAKLTFSPDGRYLAATNLSGLLTMWELPEGKEVKRFEGVAVHNFAFAADSRRFAWSSKKTVAVWDQAERKEILRIDGAAEFAFDQGGDVLVTGLHDDHHVRVTDVRTGRVQRHLNGPDRAFSELEMRTIGGRLWLATLKPESRNQDWSLVEAATEHLFIKDRYGRNVAVSPDGRVFAQGTGFMEIATASKMGEFFPKQGGYIETVAFPPDGRWFATGSTNSTVLIWDWTKASGLRVQANGRLDAEMREWFWKDLAANDGIRAQRAVQAFAADADAVAFLKEKLPPATEKELAHTRSWIRDLDNDSAEWRDYASRQVAEKGRAAEPLLQRTLDGKPSAEMKRRIEQVLDSPELYRWSSESLREIRVVQILEQLNTPEARQLLDELAKGVPDALLTKEARAARQRLAARPNK